MGTGNLAWVSRVPQGPAPDMSRCPSHMVSKAVTEGLPARPLKSDSSGVEGWCLLLSGLGKTLTHSECASPSGKMRIIVRIKGDDVNNVLSTLSGTIPMSRPYPRPIQSDSLQVGDLGQEFLKLSRCSA